MTESSSEAFDTYNRIDSMDLAELYEMLLLEVEDAKEEGELSDLPKIRFRGTMTNPAEVLQIAKYGIMLPIDIRYILSDAVQPFMHYNAVRIPFYDIMPFTDFMDEVENRKILLRRALKKIYQPRDSDVRSLDRFDAGPEVSCERC